MMVKQQPSETAGFFGFHDCGRLAVGNLAAVNVIDYATSHLHIPQVGHERPMNGRRLMQRVDGCRHTFVVGGATFKTESAQVPRTRA